MRSVFLIFPKLDGIRVEKNWNTLGMRATRSDNLALENVFVPKKSLYCAIPNAGTFVSEREPLYNLPYTAVYLGVAVGHSKPLNRRSISVCQGLQAVARVPCRHPKTYRSSRCAIGAARLIVRICAWHLDPEGQTATVTASYSKTKYFVGETVAPVTCSCLEMGGAHVLFKGNALELLFRDGVTVTPSD